MIYNCHLLIQTLSTGNGRFVEGEYSSTIYPIDGRDTIYNGNVALPSRPSLSAKVSFPALVGESSGLNLHQKGYELVLRHIDLLKDDDVRKRAQQGIEALLHVISRDVYRQCSIIPPGLIIRAIALSIPAHWTLEFEDLYRAMITKSFKYKGDIFFLTEAEALAHYLYREHRPILVPAQDDDEGSIVLIMDFGGHNMNACVIHIAGGSDEDPGFYHLTKAGDAGGGSEQWEHYIAQECLQEMIREGFIKPQHDATPKQRQSILDDFNRFKRDHCEDTNADFEFQYLKRRGGTERLCLGADKIAAAHEKAFESALQKADAMIKEAANLSNKTARIIVTGGSVKSKLTREKLEKQCREHKMIDGLEFISQQGVSSLVSLKIRYRYLDSREECLLYQRCYNFLDLGFLPQGKWSFRISIVERDGGTMFQLDGNGESHSMPGRIIMDKTWLFPLYTNIGANAAHLGNADETPEAIFAPFWDDLRTQKKGYVRAPAKRNPHMSSRESSASPEIDLVYPTSKEPPPPSPTYPLPLPTRGTAAKSREAFPYMGEDAVTKETITVRPFWQVLGREILSEFNGTSFTSVNQVQNLQEVGAQGLGLMEMFRTPSAHRLGHSMGEPNESHTWRDN
ncbi:hypothetical protein E0Z10_g3083 [Xylaria hypoxylon]|uniref:Actin-like ATPase domain-containing protein n=1 Tax=Xylaria hypoxylon TaxID=37992 RepID=A0A4Z0Z1P6_9PEZI|nr:hypothetical protein E0Z10_g3083 [Xylaria hypoxylon]